jgi:hypothetical protein
MNLPPLSDSQPPALQVIDVALRSRRKARKTLHQMIISPLPVNFNKYLFGNLKTQELAALP